MSELDRQRERFEAWIRGPPFSHTCDRNGPDSAWPGSYQRIETELAWEAWKERHYQAVEEIAALKHDNERLMESLNKCEAEVERAAEEKRELVEALRAIYHSGAEDSGFTSCFEWEKRWPAWRGMEDWQIAREALAKIDKENKNEDA